MNSTTASRVSWRFSLGTVLLLVFAASTWFAFFRLQSALPELKTDIARLESLLPNRLDMSDPRKVSIAMQRPTWNDENIWELFLPDEHRYELVLATRNVDEKGLTEPAHAVNLAPGKHRVELVSTRKLADKWITEILIDGQSCILAEEPLTWNEGKGSSGGSQVASNQFSCDDEIVLFRRRWMKVISPKRSRTPRGPCNGQLLWLVAHESNAGNETTDGQ